MLRVFPAAVVIAAAVSAQTFEAASVRPAPPPGSPDAFNGVAMRGGPGTSDPASVRILNFSLKGLISEAWEIPFYQISGPGWTEEMRYEITAALPKDATREQFHAMLRNLVTERFRLSIHNEQRYALHYSLVVARNGPKLSKHTANPVKVAQKQNPDGGLQLPAGQTSVGIGGSSGHPQAVMQAYNESVSWLVKMLSGQLGTNVTDDTGLTEKYDYTMSWVPQRPGSGPPVTDDGPGIFSALQEQLGLRLIARRGMAQTIVIDWAEKTPSEN